MISYDYVLVFPMARQHLSVRAVVLHAEDHTLGWCRQWSILKPLIVKGAWNGTGVVGLSLSREVLHQHYGFGTAQMGVSITAFGVGLAVNNFAVGYLRRHLKRDRDMFLLVLAPLMLSMSTFMLLPLPLPVALFCLGTWDAVLGLGTPTGAMALASHPGPDKDMTLSFTEVLNSVAVLISVSLAMQLLELKGSLATLRVLGTGLGIDAWFTVLDWFVSRRSDEALPLHD